MSRACVILQARMGSSRLPGKVMLDLNGRPVLAHVIERAKKIPHVEEVIVATTTDNCDFPLMTLARACGASAFAGNEDDVLDRYYQVANRFQIEVVVRLTADCPLLDPAVSGAVLERFLQADVDYASNTNPPTFPDGLDTEVFSRAALERAWREAALKSEREHVTPYIWKNPNMFRMVNVSNPVDLSDYRWTIDEPKDFEFVRAVYSHLALNSPNSFAMSDVLKALAQEPELRELNLEFVRNEGYAKSLNEDQVI